MDQSLMKSEMFFFVATIGFAAVSILLIAGLFYVLSILRTIKAISKTAKEGTDAVVEGIKDAKESIRQDGLTLSFFTQLFKKFYKKKK